MKKCDQCQKPLSQFEVIFHREANSPPAVSGKCWRCSRADQAFEKANLDKPNHKTEITVCILCLILSVALFLPLVPYLDQYTLPPLLQVHMYVALIGMIALGTLSTSVIFSRKKKKKDLLPMDPPEERYHNNPGTSHTSYVSKERYDGAIVTEKVTRYTGGVEDQWNWSGASTDSGNRIVKLYGDFCVGTIKACAYVFAGTVFLIWVIPYICVVLSKDQKSAKYRAKIPRELRRAYKIGKEKAKNSPLSYHHKVGFLVSRENCKKAKAKPKSFLDNFSSAETSTGELHPFFYTRIKNISYMIVDYRHPTNKNYGISFVLVENRNGSFAKKMVIEDEFVDSNEQDWQSDWKESGASPNAYGNIRWYENKFRSILNSHKKSKEILG